MSRRFGPENKLLMPIEGEPVVRRIVRAYLGADLARVLVVVGHDADAVRGALKGLDIRFVTNPDYTEGQSRALVRGVSALDDSVGAAVIGVADQPYLTSDVLRSIVSLWRRLQVPAVAPRYAGERGNPILFDRRLFPELLQVTGDRGGRSVFARHADEALYVDVGARHGLDIDTPDDYNRLR
jgi:molybdenum cofactor cytidylyltransferase